MLEEDEEGGDEDEDEDEDDVDETSDDKMMNVQTDVSSGMGGANIPLEGTAAAAVEKEEHGDEHVIAEKLHNLTLDQEIQEASPVKSPKKSVASPLKEQSKSNSQALSKSHWRPWE